MSDDVHLTTADRANENVDNYVMQTDYRGRAVRITWKYRGFIARGVLVAAVVFALAIIGLYLFLPVKREVSVNFRLLFDGVEKGEYPNGMPFSVNDLIAGPILEEVYSSNDLKRYLDFDHFKKSFFVQQSNKELDFLDDEYRAKLSENKLSLVERDRIEKEYQSKIEGLSRSDFQLKFIWSERVFNLPDSSARKVIDDVLTTWAGTAEHKKDVLKYNIRVFSKNIIRKDVLQSEDYIISMDIIRIHINRILKNIEEISRLPGASVFRIEDSNLSLADVNARLQDLLRFRVDPLIGFIRSFGLSKSRQSSIEYLKNQLFLLKIDREASSEEISVLEKSLHNYVQDKLLSSAGVPTKEGTTGGFVGTGNGTTLIPQLGESFFEKLVEMSSKNDDTAFRQKLTERIIFAGKEVITIDKEVNYYSDVLAAFEKPVAHSSQGDLEFNVVYEKKFNQIVQEVLDSMDKMTFIYEELSRQNLNPGTMLFRITQPASIDNRRPMSLITVILVFFLYIILTFAALLACSFIYEYSINSRNGKLAKDLVK